MDKQLEVTSNFFVVALLVLRKDVAIEVKSLEIISTTLFFAVSSVLVFAFALVREGSVVADAAAGILWIAIAFAGTYVVGKGLQRFAGGGELTREESESAYREALNQGRDIAHSLQNRT